MAQVYVKYNPYRLETQIRVNGRDVSTDSILYKVTRGKRLQEWIGRFPQMLREELNTVDFSLEYCGMALDWDDFEDAFEQARKEGIVKVSGMKYIAGKSDAPFRPDSNSTSHHRSAQEFPESHGSLHHKPPRRILTHLHQVSQ